MQNTDKKQQAALKVWKVINQLQLSSSEESVQTLIELYNIATILTANDIDEWLSIDGLESSSRYLEGILIKHGYDQADAVLVTRSLSKIDNSMLKAIMRLIKEDALPNHEVAVTLMEALQTRRRGQGGSVTKEIADLSYKLAAKHKEPKSALCMGVTADGFALTTSSHMHINYELPTSFLDQTIRKQLFRIAGTSIKLSDISISDSTTYDYGLISDSWGTPQSRMNFNDAIKYEFQDVASEVMSVQRMLPRIEGRLICLIPIGWLHKTSAQDLKFKQHLVSNGIVEAVIQLPPNILPDTSIPSALLVLNTLDKNDEIQFINAGSDKFVKAVSRNNRKLSNYDEVVELFGSHEKSDISNYVPTQTVLNNDCNLDVKRYIQSPEAQEFDAILKRYPEQMELGDLVEIIRCQAIKSENDGEDENSGNYMEIRPFNIDQYGILTKSSEYRQVIPSKKDVARAEKQKVRAKDIIFAIKGTLGKSALIDHDYEDFIAGQSFIILRLRNDAPISEIELFRFLSSELGREQVERWSVGATVPMIKMHDIKKLSVPIPTIQQQESLRESHKNIISLIQQKRSIERTIDQSIKDFWS